MLVLAPLSMTRRPTWWAWTRHPQARLRAVRSVAALTAVAMAVVVLVSGSAEALAVVLVSAAMVLIFVLRWCEGPLV